jgi:large subunit ribosomal protein L23
MAIFSKKENTETTDDVVETTATTPVVTEATPDVAIALDASASRSLVIPRLSEKSGKMNALNKYVFTIYGKTNKIEARKAVEAQYGVKVAQVNMITMAGRTKRFGRRMGTTSAFKKAIVTLKPGSKKIDLVEPS